MISEWGVTPLSATGWFKNTRWRISHYDFRMGCDPPPFGNRVVHLRKKFPPQQQQQQQQQQQPQQQQQLGSLHDLSAFGRR